MNKPQISADEFAQRRKALIQQIGNQAIAIVSAASLKVRNRDAEYSFRQDSDFLYLSHFNEPDAILVLVPERVEGEFILFCQEKNPKIEQWTGVRAGLEGAKSLYAADESFCIDQIDQILPSLMEGKQSIYYSMANNFDFDQRVMQWLASVKKKIRQGITAPHQLINLDQVLHEMRLIKSTAEIAMMQYAADVSIAAHHIAMRQCLVGQYEYEMEALFKYAFASHGMSEAYTSIVGSGENACILHYINNDQPLNNKELLLIDAGAEYQAYASDITRTFPINGHFTEAQKQLYQIVLDAQRAAIAVANPNHHWDEPHQAAVAVITEGLLKLGILKADNNQSHQENIQQLIKDEAYTPYYMHKTGHWLGLDVHDVGDYRIDGQWRTLQAGMVITVEPGLYISPSENIDQKWWNIGIRIEDDVLITDQGNRVLTQALIKEVDDIEALMLSN
jgi:Xaa-Pro aminopeptidase